MSKQGHHGSMRLKVVVQYQGRRPELAMLAAWMPSRNPTIMLIFKEFRKRVSLQEVLPNVRMGSSVASPSGVSADAIPNQLKCRLPRRLNVHKCFFTEHPGCKKVRALQHAIKTS